MKISRHLLGISVVAVGVLLIAGPVRTQESQITSFFLASSDNSQLFSLGGILDKRDPLIPPGSSVWFQELSPLDLALLPKGAWISATNRGGPSANDLWRRPANVFGGDPLQRLLASEGSKDEWGPLSEEALNAWKKEFTSKALECSAELADSLRASYLSEGIEWAKDAVSSYHDMFAKRYRLHFKVSDKQAAVHYDLQY